MSENIMTLNNIIENNRNKYRFGIEVSELTEYIDGSKLKDYDYIYIRLGVYFGYDDFRIDSSFLYYYAIAKKYNIPLGVYVYMYTNVSTIDKIDKICQTISSELDKISFDYPFLIDIQASYDMDRDIYLLREFERAFREKNYFTICNHIIPLKSNKCEMVSKFEYIYSSDNVISISDRYVKTKSERILGMLTDINNVDETSEPGKPKFIIAGFISNMPVKLDIVRYCENEFTPVVCTVSYKNLNTYIKIKKYKNWKG